MGMGAVLKSMACRFQILDLGPMGEMGASLPHFFMEPQAIALGSHSLFFSTSPNQQNKTNRQIPRPRPLLYFKREANLQLQFFFYFFLNFFLPLLCFPTLGLFCYPRFLPASPSSFFLRLLFPPPSHKGERFLRLGSPSHSSLPPPPPPLSTLPSLIAPPSAEKDGFLPRPSMENHTKTQDKQQPTPLQASSLNTTSNSSGNYGTTNGATTSTSPPAPPHLPLVPKSIPKGPDVNPYPTTFVQADTSSFKQVVQMLTGSAETAAAAAAATATSKGPIAPAAKPPGPKKPAFKLYERRNSLKNLKIISPLIPTFFNSNSNPNSPVGVTAFSPRHQPDILSPSMLDFPSLVLSPVTPLIPDPFNRPPHPGSEAAKLAEDRAIAEKGFYLHPSPRTTPRDADPPRLLPLFPVTSPRVSSSAPPSP